MQIPSYAAEARGGRGDTNVPRHSVAGLGPWVGARNYLEQRLIVIWERIIKVAPIGIYDRWSDLCGDTRGASMLLCEIEENLGRRLSFSALSPTDTIAKLSSLIDPRPAVRSQPILIFQPEGKLPPLHCVHGLHGTGLFASLLARNIGSDQPVIGFQARGFTGEGPPGDSIGAIAADYNDTIRLWRGPYRLIGWCVGSMIAFEMAQQLLLKGEEVARLILVDPPALPIQTLAASPGQEAIQRLRNRGSARGMTEAYQEAAINVIAGIDRAARAYQPRPYTGELAILSSKENHVAFTDATSPWRALAKGGLMLKQIAPTHMSIVGEYAPSLGANARRLIGSA